MNTIDVIATIKIYEIDGTETTVGNAKKLQVSSHWNRNELIDICFEGKTLTVAANDLVKAIKNTTNA